LLKAQIHKVVGISVGCSCPLPLCAASLGVVVIVIGPDGPGKSDSIAKFTFVSPGGA
jgi:hypothetical protein